MKCEVRERCGEGGRAGNIKRGGKMKEDRKREKEREGLMGELVCRRLFFTRLFARFYEFLMGRVMGPGNSSCLPCQSKEKSVEMSRTAKRNKHTQTDGRKREGMRQSNLKCVVVMRPVCQQGETGEGRWGLQTRLITNCVTTSYSSSSQLV